jgi:hypothetical protein
MSFRVLLRNKNYFEKYNGQGAHILMSSVQEVGDLSYKQYAELTAVSTTLCIGDPLHQQYAVLASIPIYDMGSW